MDFGCVNRPYMIDPDHSDQVLAVKLGADGSLASIDWES